MKKAAREEKRNIRRQKRENRKVKLKNRSRNFKQQATLAYQKYKNIVSQNIRLEILTVVCLAFVVAFITGALFTGITKGMGFGRYEYTTYEKEKENIQETLVDTVRDLSSLDYMSVVINTDINTLAHVMTDIRAEEGGMHSFAQYLCDSITIQTINGYGSDEIQSTMLQNIHGDNPEVIKLYKELANLNPSSEWNEGLVDQTTELAIHQALEEFYAKQKITAEGAKESYMKEVLEHLNSSSYNGGSITTYLLDAEGNTLYTTGIIKTIDIVETIKQTSNTDNYGEESKLSTLYPVVVDGQVHYLYTEATLRGYTNYDYTETPLVVGILIGMVMFVLVIFKLTTAKIRYIEYLSKCLHEISKGNLDYKIEIKGQDELAQVAKDIEYMEQEIKRQIDERMQSEKTKNELITNVAHDLRTPLTSIIGYMGLVKEGKYESKEDAKKYLEIAYSKSEKLKVLMEDLFEYTKLSNRAVELRLDKISSTTLMNQLIEELNPLAEEKNISIKLYTAADETAIHVDIMKMTRVFENLLENAIKYSESDENVQVIIQNKNGYVYTSVRNRVTELPQGDINKLFDRFYRSDASRNSQTGGSGLGLAIAKNIVEMHGGRIWAQVDGDMLSFNVKLKKI